MTNPNNNGIFFYKLRCSDGSYYMGISCNLEKRLFAHATGTGVMFLRRKGKLPFTLVFKKVFRTLQEAKKYERVAKSRKRFDV